MGSHIFEFFGVRQFFIFTIGKRTRMFVLQMKSKVFFIQSKKWVNSKQQKVTELESRKWHICPKVTTHPAKINPSDPPPPPCGTTCVQRLILSSWVRKRKGGSAFIASILLSHRSPDLCTSQSCFLKSNWFFRVRASVIDKPKVTTEPAVSGTCGTSTQKKAHPASRA